MPHLILSTIGTSLLTNEAPRAIIADLRACANARSGELAPDMLHHLESHARERQAQLRAAGMADARRLSAEINGLVAMRGEPFRPGHDGTPDHHLLVATDTWQGRRAAEIVAEWLETQGCTAETVVPPGLRTDSLASFRSALAALARDLHERIEGYRRGGYRIAFNLTGGFKSVNGFLQALAAVWADESFYLFESSQEPMRIPRLPLDFAPERMIERDLEAWRRLAVLNERPRSPAFPEIMMLSIDDAAMLSEWGELVWQSGRGVIYERELHEPATPRLRLGPALRGDVRRLGLTREQLRLLNDQLDELTRWVHSNRQHNPKSLSVKGLEGNPVPGSTHEVYAWSGHGGYRLFGHLEDDVFVLDHLGRHL